MGQVRQPDQRDILVTTFSFLPIQQGRNTTLEIANCNSNGSRSIPTALVQARKKPDPFEERVNGTPQLFLDSDRVYAFVDQPPANAIPLQSLPVIDLSSRRPNPLKSNQVVPSEAQSIFASSSTSTIGGKKWHEAAMRLFLSNIQFWTDGIGFSNF